METLPMRCRKPCNSELMSQEGLESRGFVSNGNSSDLPSHDDLPETSEFQTDFSWCNKEGENTVHSPSTYFFLLQVGLDPDEHVHLTRLNQDCPWFHGHRHAALCAAGIELWQRWSLLRRRSEFRLPVDAFGRLCRVYHWTDVHGLFERFQ